MIKKLELKTISYIRRVELLEYYRSIYKKSGKNFEIEDNQSNYGGGAARLSLIISKKQNGQISRFRFFKHY